MRPASNAQGATMLVQLGYGIDQGQVRYVEDPFYRSRFGYGRYGSPFFYPRFGYRSRFSYGWDDPFWYGGYGGGIDSYVEYHSQIDLHIRAARDQRSRCSTAAPRRARRPTGSTSSSRAWSRRCSPTSRARTAKR